MSFVALERLAHLYDGYRRAFRVGSRELLLLQEEGRVHLIAGRCPHMGAALAAGAVIDGALRCPRHGFEFRLTDGQPLRPSSCAPLTVYAPAYDGDRIGIALA